MPHRNVAGLVVAVLATAALVACSDQSPAAPSTPAVVASNAMPEDVGPQTRRLLRERTHLTWPPLLAKSFRVCP